MPVLEDASVQYNDMTGTVALDWHGGSEIHEFARDCAGIDTTQYFPLALSIYVALDASAREYSLGLIFYAADKSVVGGSAEDILRYAREHGGNVPTKRFCGNASLAQFHKYAKRFDVVLRGHPRKWPDISTIEYESE